MRKKFISVVICLSIIFSCIGTSFAAEQSLNKAQAGNSMSTATSISIGTTYNGSITNSNSEDFYKFTLPSSGKINLKSTAYIEWVYYNLYDANGKVIWSDDPYWDSSTKQISYNESFDLTSGTYYLSVEQHNSYYTGNYNLKLSFTSANESFKEGNGGFDNSMNTANSISTNVTYNGQLAENDEVDFYKFTLSSSGKINLKSTAYIEWIYYNLYDANGKVIWSDDPYWNSSTKQISYNENIDLTSGTYYLSVEQHNSYYTGNYNLKLSFTSANESFKEGNGGFDNSMNTANSISTNVTYNGQLAENDEVDFYKFTLSSSDKINLKSTAYIEWVYYNLYDANGKVIWSDDPYWNSSTKQISYNENIDLTSGTYYLSVEQHNSYYTGNYSFNIELKTSPKKVSNLKQTSSSTSEIKLSWSKVSNATGYQVYRSTSKNGTYKKIATLSGYSKNYYTDSKLSSGKIYYYKVRAYKKEGSKYYYGNYSDVYTASTKCSRPSITVTSPKTKTIKVSWKKINGANGYEVRRATSKNGTYSLKKTITNASTLSYTNTGLTKGKTYYYKVRAYKIVDGKKVYSDYSLIKYVKCK